MRDGLERRGGGAGGVEAAGSCALGHGAADLITQWDNGTNGARRCAATIAALTHAAPQIPCDERAVNVVARSPASYSLTYCRLSRV